MRDDIKKKPLLETFFEDLVADGDILALSDPDVAIPAK